MFWILPLPLPWPFWQRSPLGASITFWYFGERPQCCLYLCLGCSTWSLGVLRRNPPGMAGDTRDWVLALFCLSPPRPLLSALEGSPSFTLGKIWPYTLSFPWGHIPQRLGLIFVADGLQAGETNFLPRRKIQFDISNYHSLHIGCLNKYKCKTSSYGWSWSHGK